MEPALSQVCTLIAPFETDIEGYSAGACRAIELWTGKLDSYLERHSEADFHELLERHGVVAPVASFQGGLLVSQGEFRKRHWEAFSRRLAQLRSLGVTTLVVAGDVHGTIAQQDIERVRVSLEQAATLAASHDVRLALEFQGRATLCNNLESAAALVAEISNPSLGLCLDVFHYHTGPSKTEDLQYLTPENLFHVQLCDLAGIARELAIDADRILPGDGDISLEPLVTRLREIGYDGLVSVELMNSRIWQISPRQFGEVGMTALRKVLGQASMT